MGQVVVNGEVIEVRGERPTGKAVKEAAHSPTNDWLMASMPSGELVQVRDHEQVPERAVDYVAVPAWEYGCGG